MAKGLWVVLNVDNVDKSLEFYKAIGLKGAREAQGPMSWGVVRASDDAGLVLWNKNDLAPDQAADTRAWLSGELGKGVVLTLGVPNAARLWEKAQAARVPVDQPLRAQEWGGHEFTVVDPDGYVVNLSDRFPGPSPRRPAAKARKAARKGAAKAKRAAKGTRRGTGAPKRKGT